MITIARTAVLLLASLVFTTASIYAVAELAVNGDSYWLSGTNSSRWAADYTGESGVRFSRLRATTTVQASSQP